MSPLYQHVSTVAQNGQTWLSCLKWTKVSLFLIKWVAAGNALVGWSRTASSWSSLPDNFYFEKFETTIWLRMADHIYFLQERHRSVKKQKNSDAERYLDKQWHKTRITTEVAFPSWKSLIMETCLQSDTGLAYWTGKSNVRDYNMTISKCGKKCPQFE